MDEKTTYTLWYFITGSLVWFYLNQFEINLFFLNSFSSNIQERSNVFQVEVENLPSNPASSVWCTGNTSLSRMCHFRNLYYDAASKKFIFLVGNLSHLSGFAHSEILSLVYLSGLAGKETAFLNLDLVPLGGITKAIVDIEDPVILMHRYDPDSVFHSLHSDLYPLFIFHNTLCRGRIKSCAQKYKVFFTDLSLSNTTNFLYGNFLLNLSTNFNNMPSIIYCFKEVKAGMIKHYVTDQVDRSSRVMKPDNYYSVLKQNPSVVEQFFEYALHLNGIKFTSSNCKIKHDAFTFVYKNISENNIQSLKKSLHRATSTLFPNYLVSLLEDNIDNLEQLLCSFIHSKGILYKDSHNLFIFFTPFYTLSFKTDYTKRNYIVDQILHLISTNNSLKQSFCPNLCNKSTIIRTLEEVKYSSNRTFYFFDKLIEDYKEELLVEQENIANFLEQVCENLDYDLSSYKYFHYLPMKPFPSAPRNLSCYRLEMVFLVAVYKPPWNQAYFSKFQIEYFAGFSKRNALGFTFFIYSSVGLDLKTGWSDSWIEFPKSVSLEATIKNYLPSENASYQLLHPERLNGPSRITPCPELSHKEIVKLKRTYLDTKHFPLPMCFLQDHQS